MAQSTFNIDITAELTDFEHYVESNSNIIFSAKFGDGKSYFLHQFKEMQKEKYYFITLYPVNYVIAKNEDVIEYIKRDILFQLIRDGHVGDSMDFKTMSSSIFTEENLKELTDFLMGQIPGGKLISDAVWKIKCVKDNYEENKQTLDKYIESFKNHPGCLYELDAFSEFIRTGLELVKRNGRETVLVIEDLDRIDPHDLFRILNVFSSQIDKLYYSKDEEEVCSKFGFDKTIFVLDYKQTKKIFNHFYGNCQAYEGYMSKFSPALPFNYSVTRLAQRMLVEKIAGETKLQNLFVKDIKGFSEKLEVLSIRDIKSIWNADYSSFLRPENYTTIPSRNSLTCLFFYLSRMGYKLSDFAKLWDCEKIYFDAIVEIYAPLLLLSNNTSTIRLKINTASGCFYAITVVEGCIDIQRYGAGNYTMGITIEELYEIVSLHLNYLLEATFYHE